MFCPFCEKESVGAFGHCNFCGRELSPASHAPLAAPATVAPAVSADSFPPTLTPVASAAPAPAPRPIPLRSKKRKQGLIAVIVVVAVGVIGGGVFVIENVNRETPEQRLSRLAREAAGLQPVHNPFFASDRQFDDAFRDQFRNVIRVSREYAALQRKIDQTELDKIGTPESIVDPTYAAEGVRQLHESYMLDRDLEAKVLEIGINLRTTVESTGWSTSTRKSALAAFDTGFAQPLEKRSRLLNAEQLYIDVVDDIYQYANAHYTDFAVQDGVLRTNSDSALQDFNKKMDLYSSRFNDMLEARQGFNRFQAETLRKRGMNPSDAGLQ